MVKKVPTLTLDGYLDNTDFMMTKLFEYFVLSEYSQTKLFYGEISSLPYLVRDAGPDFNKLEDSVKDTLFKLYNRYWGNVDVDVGIKEEKINEHKHRVILVINVEVVHDGKTYTLNKSASIEDNEVKKIDNKIDYFLGA